MTIFARRRWRFGTSGPAATVKTFGEVYAFSPGVLAVRRDQPTQIIFWKQAMTGQIIITAP